MKRLLLTLAVMALVVPAAAADPPHQVGPSDHELRQWQWYHLPEVWNLQTCDLTLSYTINLAGVPTPGWNPVQVGVRQVGGPDIDPNFLGGWLMSRYANAGADDNRAEINDYHVLMKHGWSYEYYDLDAYGNLIDPPIIPWSYVNYAFWFDRDGVDPFQETFWNYKDGITYNTDGSYRVVLSYSASDANNGAMYVRINDDEAGNGAQGFYTQGYRSDEPPATWGVGRTFTGRMNDMQVFLGRGGGGGAVTITDLTARGCFAVLPVAIRLRPGGDNQVNTSARQLVPVAILGEAGFVPCDDVDIFSVRSTGASASPTRFDCEDVDGDGHEDMVVHFRARDFDKPTADECDDPDAELLLTGNLNSGVPLSGADSVRWIGPHCK